MYLALKFSISACLSLISHSWKTISLWDSSILGRLDDIPLELSCHSIKLEILSSNSLQYVLRSDNWFTSESLDWHRSWMMASFWQKLTCYWARRLLNSPNSFLNYAILGLNFNFSVLHWSSWIWVSLLFISYSYWIFKLSKFICSCAIQAFPFNVVYMPLKISGMLLWKLKKSII